MERAATAVRREAIGLDRDAEARPREVETVATSGNLDRLLTDRLRQPAPK